MRTIALTPGNIDGIGPELFPLALQKADIDVDTKLIWCADTPLFIQHARGWHIETEHSNGHIRLQGRNGTLKLTCTNAKHPLLDAIDMARRQEIDAIVTGPMRKASVVDHDGKRYDGQTELLHRYLHCDDDPPLMCFGGYYFWLALATIHVPIREVADRITIPLITSHLKRLAQLGNHITVLGLNPHAGENGLIGDEEIRFIKPAIEQMRRDGLTIEGPLAADGFFANLPNRKLPDSVLAMTHDQGLAPYKLLAGAHAINTTLGLTITRTSPAHGTADDLVGQYTANPSSLVKAIETAQLNL